MTSYTGARKGERYFTLSALVGDVILTQPDAYSAGGVQSLDLTGARHGK